MPFYLPQLTAALLTAGLVSATPTSDYSHASAIAGKASCSSIVLDNTAVPAGETLDLTGLKAGTKITNHTTLTLPSMGRISLIKMSGFPITVQAASGAFINADGTRWWDGKGSNGGKTKAKFFFTHSLDDSSITGQQILSTPVQTFGIQSDNLVLSGIHIDNSAGDSNGDDDTDGFDISDSTGVTIEDAVAKNQDDGLAINSGENIYFTGSACSGGHGLSIGSDVTGTVDSRAHDIYLRCGSGSCSKWTWSDVKITGGKSSTNCKNVRCQIDKLTRSRLFTVPFNPFHDDGRSFGSGLDLFLFLYQLALTVVELLFLAMSFKIHGFV
ncbi:Polygalacturonase [Penicillium ucsense]|uniref:Polygalacturonase n=1 Tax=Penicillium ucsense TaxID=2839758 RepID=A0A8J8W444_9EURO|nr:Polygalacturonase [Penicillium ucsense]KAF7734926.1 Polygalacturonase [Penicillium ucsense]